MPEPKIRRNRSGSSSYPGGSRYGVVEHPGEITYRDAKIPAEDPIDGSNSRAQKTQEPKRDKPPGGNE